VCPIEVESALAGHIKVKYTEPGQAAMRSTVATLAIDTFASLPEDQIRVERFPASPRWVDGVMDRCHLCLRIAHSEGRTEIDSAIAADFKAKLQSARGRYAAHRILKLDETSWRCYLAPSKVMAEKESPGLPRGEKEWYTAYGCISAAGEKLPFSVPTKGKTDRSHAKFGAAPALTIGHTPTGSTTAAVMVTDVGGLSVNRQCELLMLVLDVYKAHRTAKLTHVRRN
jgi:hypothetical protein